MRRFLNEVLLALTIALVGGIGTALLVIDRNRDSGAVTIGPWVARAGTTGPQDNPYARALVATRIELPLDAAEGIVFTTSVDSTGEPLISTCDYRVGGAAPAARLWSLSAYDAIDGLMTTANGRTVFHSQEIIRAEPGRFEIVVSQSVKPGNWLPVSADADLLLVLRLYDTALGTTLGGDAPVLPSIIRGRCR